MIDGDREGYVEYWKQPRYDLEMGRHVRALARARKRERRWRVGIYLALAVWTAAIVIYGIFNAY
jgi:hypothetical protein